jgi:hypothetical protein
MFRIRASRPDSLGACKSFDPGSRGAITRGGPPLTNRVVGPAGFLHARIRLSGAALLAGAAFLHAMRVGKDHGIMPTNPMDRQAIANRAKELRRQAAIAELKKNGIDVDFRQLTNGEQTPLDEFELEYEPSELHRAVKNSALKVHVVSACDEFRSAPNARPMSADDVSNIETLSPDDCREVLKRLASLLGYREVESLINDQRGFTPAWPVDDRRWTLTPHQLRQATEKRLRARSVKVVG